MLAEGIKFDKDSMQVGLFGLRCRGMMWLTQNGGALVRSILLCF